MKKRYSPEQIVGKLRQADMELGKGKRVPEVCRLLEISEQTYYIIGSVICRIQLDMAGL